MEIQEMGVDGQGSAEPGGSNDDKIFFMKYPYPFLQYWYGNFPLSQLEKTEITHRHVNCFFLIC
jgi:hypothetical protein